MVRKVLSRQDLNYNMWKRVNIYFCYLWHQKPSYDKKFRIKERKCCILETTTYITRIQKDIYLMKRLHEIIQSWKFS